MVESLNSLALGSSNLLQDEAAEAVTKCCLSFCWS